MSPVVKVLLVLLGWLGLSVLVAVTVGRVISAHEERREREDQLARKARGAPQVKRVAPRAIRDPKVNPEQPELKVNLVRPVWPDPQDPRDR